MNGCRAIVLTLLKWLAHALAHSLLVTSLTSQTEKLWTRQVVLIIMAKLVVLLAILFQSALCEFRREQRAIVVRRAVG